MENQSTLLKDAQEAAVNLISSKVSKNVRFHTLQHTREVVAACEKIAETLPLSDEDKIALNIAAWFHDTGTVPDRQKTMK